jgi:hypothetical protein
MTNILVGPVGGLGGYEFNDYLLPPGARLKEIHVFAALYVDAIQLVYAEANGNHAALPKIGGLGGKHHVLTLNDDEYLVGISGRHDWYIDSIRFHTNRRTSEIYGGPRGEWEFCNEAPTGHEIAGLFGRVDWYIDAIGIIARPLNDIGASADHQSARMPKPDDLQRVEGVTSGIADLLIAHGIYDRHDLAITSVDRLKAILGAAGAPYVLSDPTEWPALAKGKR